MFDGTESFADVLEGESAKRLKDHDKGRWCEKRSRNHRQCHRLGGSFCRACVKTVRSQSQPRSLKRLHDKCSRLRCHFTSTLIGSRACRVSSSFCHFFRRKRTARFKNGAPTAADQLGDCTWIDNPFLYYMFILSSWASIILTYFNHTKIYQAMTMILAGRRSLSWKHLTRIIQMIQALSLLGQTYALSSFQNPGIG